MRGTDGHRVLGVIGLYSFSLGMQVLEFSVKEFSGRMVALPGHTREDARGATGIQAAASTSFASMNPPRRYPVVSAYFLPGLDTCETGYLARRADE